MIHTDILHHTGESAEKIIRSHRLQPSEGVTIFCIFTGQKESTVSILEDHLLESISTIEWDDNTLSSDFTYISENFNHFIQNIEESDLEDLGLVFGVLIGTELVFSHIGQTSILLVEKDGSINNLSNADLSKMEFQSISNGEILPGTHVYLSSTSLESRLSDDIIKEISQLNTSEWKDIVGGILKKDIQESIHVIHITNELKKESRFGSKKTKQLDILRASSKELVAGIDIVKRLVSIRKYLGELLYSKQIEVKYTLLIAGVIIFFSLVYLLFSAISGALSSPAIDTKSELIRAQELINNSQKIINNPQAFNKTIAEAEAILFQLRDKRIHMTDTQSLLSRIEAMKKEVNDIQTIDISKLNTILNITEGEFEGIGSYEYNKKTGFIGTNSAIMGHSRGGAIPKEVKYPLGHIGKDFDVTEDGVFYILTDDNRILSQRGNDISYTTTNGKNEWDTSNILATFNGNIYLATPDLKGINRYRPGINGFSTASTIISTLEDNVVDIGIDGGIYVLLKNGKIIRYIGGSTGNQKNLTINKVPGEYNIGSEDNTKLFVKPNLSYIYILSGKNIWIFSPDSRRFQDVTAWNYVAQLELQTQEDVKNIHIPRDGLIHISTKSSIYELVFEVADNKIILR